jgi:hypothetical protein
VLRCDNDGVVRVGVFLDYRNVHAIAQRAFATSADLLRGFSPFLLAQEVMLRAFPDEDVALALVEVHWSHDDPQGPVCRELVDLWAADSPTVRVLVRRRGRNGKEIGVDVACALGCVHAMLDQPRRCDVAILFSADLDLRPAVELLVRELPADHSRTASWRVPGAFEMCMPTDGLHRGPANVALDESVLTAALRP